MLSPMIRLAALLAITVPTALSAQARDPMEPLPNAGPAIVSPLRVVTLTTTDMIATRRFYQGGLGMTPISRRLTGAAAQALIRHYDLAPASSVEMVLFAQPGLPDGAVVRAISVAAKAFSRPDYNAEYVGALGMGVPARGLAKREAIVNAFGSRAQVGVTEMDFPRADKTTYTVGEIHFLAPDNVLVLGVDRGPMNPVGPIDPAVDIGAPSYVSMIVDDAAASASFFKTVLGFEMRREFVFQSKGPTGGMRLPPKTDVKFQQWFAPGSRTGYLVIMDLLNAGKRAPSPLGLASAGLAMWTFETADLTGVRRRAASIGVREVARPTRIDVPGLGPALSLIVATPDGFPVEIVQRIRHPR